MQSPTHFFRVKTGLEPRMLITNPSIPLDIVSHYHTEASTIWDSQMHTNSSDSSISKTMQSTSKGLLFAYSDIFSSMNVLLLH